MARLIYSMMTSLDGYTADADGDFGWGLPQDEELHSFVNELSRPVGTYLYGRRIGRRPGEGVRPGREG